MNSVRLVLLTGTMAALGACGSHNNAPVVYGTDPARQTRVYRSADDIYREQRTAAAQPAYQPPVYQPAKAQQRSAAALDPVELSPIQAVYLDDRERPVQLASAQATTRSAPPQTAATPPAHLHKAKGYVEAQPGDTVYALARRFNVKPQAIIDENDLRAPYALKVGQAIKLPSGAAALVADAPTRRVVAQDALYSVRSGDTLYSISRASGVPVAKIAAANNLNAPYSLSVGRQIVIPEAPAGALQVAEAPRKPAPQSAPAANVAEIARNVSYTKPAPVAASSMFDWPVRGSVVSAYGSGNLGRRNDGVNISAPLGSAVRAAADGQVVYRGSELEGFGNLLLVKHADGYVTAYAHNDSMMVKKGDTVRKGQMIAKVGQTGAVTSPQLHFEIRQELQTIDPVALLGNP